jgi:oxygen-independent coproporphyrinogen-3 oxidase
MQVCFDQDLIVRYGGRGPRYTSYPTALQFHENLTDPHPVLSHALLLLRL